MKQMKLSREQVRVLKILTEKGGVMEFHSLRFDWGVSERTILSMEKKKLIEREREGDSLFFRTRTN